MAERKILVLDIETRPATAYVWGLFDQNIGLSQLITPSAPICFAAKFVGEKGMHFYSEWEHGRKEMIVAAHELMSEADAIVTYNGDRFDIPKLRGEFVLEGLLPPPPLTSIDVLKSVKKLGFQSNKLAYVGPLLKVGQKVDNEGFGLWSAVIDGDGDAQERMKTYCIGDVLLLEEVYDKLRPYIVNHPHMGDIGAGACGACGSHQLQKRGFRRTKSFMIQRMQCTTCGAWQDGARKKV